MSLDIKEAGAARWDCVSLGEVMLRLDPGWTRIRAARSFDVWEGGGEYNVARALASCFGLRTAAVTALVENEVGRLVQGLMQAGGVDTRHVHWTPYDGFGGNGRVGLNFTEKGYGIRPARSVYDRGHTAIAEMRPGDIDWAQLFHEEGVRWFHTGGIYAALAPQSIDVLLEALQVAKASGALVSYDLNYRRGLWAAQGGQERAIEVNRALAPYVDVMLGNEEDFTAALGFEVKGTDPDLAELDPTNFKRMIGEVVGAFPNVQVVGTTLRHATTANRNDWGAIAYAQGAFHQATTREGLEIYDRVGGGDGFASGLIYALLAGKPMPTAVEYGAAHGALTMTTPGDTSMVSLDEVEAAIDARTVRVVR
ncbi:sugar kinase [Egibacter rhizosphaerae]|uniref:Sugar kinase n=1 Tax=Egibacter rhizosphaerae TaxID=1670831 RepID=A0A411YE67_9ACTN|nr:sugar kinase [Egibacter rhizosphaerae]QBI19470.1 sugar kinase [Egibacter rhizosphaerae]